MNFKRFGRLNSKKIEKILNNGPLFDMAHCFPYLPTRSKNMRKRNKIESFKRMSQNYRYCYSLQHECIAKISVHSFEKDKKELCPNIDNNVYVFCNIAPVDFLHNDSDEMFYLVFDKKQKFPLTQINGSTFSEEVVAVFNDLVNRNMDQNQLEVLKEYLSTIDLISLESKAPKFKNLKESTFNEFKYRLVLLDKFIYETYDNEQFASYYDYIDLEVKRKRSRVEDRYSILKDINKDAIEYANNFLKQLSEAVSYKHEKSANKFIHEFLRDRYKIELYEDDIKAEDIFNDIIDIYSNAKVYLEKLKENYIFFLDPYSKEYREFFAQKREKLSLFKTQQVLRKLKSEYNSIDSLLSEINKQLQNYESIFLVINKALRDYRKDIGDNQLPNQGFGYPGDGLFDDEDDESLANQIRIENELEIEQERRDREEDKIEQDEIKQKIRDSIIDDIYEQYDDKNERDAIIKELHKKWDIEDSTIDIPTKNIDDTPTYEEEELQRQQDEENEYYERRQQEIDCYVEQKDKKGLFEYVGVNNEFFWYFKSISIKDAVDIKKWEIKDGVSLDGEFFSDKEIIDWENENVIKKSQDEIQDDWLNYLENNSNVNNENEYKSEDKLTFNSKKSDTPSNLDLDNEDDIPF